MLVFGVLRCIRRHELPIPDIFSFELKLHVSHNITIITQLRHCRVIHLYATRPNVGSNQALWHQRVGIGLIESLELYLHTPTRRYRHYRY